jgi:hypothetical protein
MILSVALWSCRSVAMTLQKPSSGREAQNEAIIFLSFFADLPDPRQPGKVIYPLKFARAHARATAFRRYLRAHLKMRES